MITSIGAFIFEAKDVKNLQKSVKAHFGTYNPMGSDPHYHNTRGSVHTVTIAGVYIASANSNISVLEGIVSAKRPVRFTMATGESMKVIVTDISTGKKDFLPYSGAVQIDFTITMKKAGGGLSLLGILGGILALF